jgi:hypothetical protein
MRVALKIALMAFALAGCGAAVGHHSFAVHYIPEKIIEMSGTVTEFRFRNPHGLVIFEVRAADGTRAEWRAETNSPNILRRRGWAPDSIKPGDRITVEGYPARDGSNMMRVYRIRFADGRELVGQRPTTGVADSED